MKKKILAAMLSAAMVATFAVGCGSNEPAPAPEPAAEEPAPEPEPAAEEPAAEEAPAEEVAAGDIPQDYKYYFSFDEADERVHSAVQVKEATPIVQITEDPVTLVNGVKGQAAYTDGTKGLKLDVNGVGETYTVSYWMFATRFANYMPTLQYGPDMHGDATGGQHYLNFTRSEWNPDGASFPCVWAYDQNAEGSPWPNWYPDEANEHMKEWLNITLTVDPSETSEDGSLIKAHLYLNGEELVGTSSDGERPVYVVKGTMAPSDNFDFLLGINYWDAIFKGCFDEVYVYDYVLDQSQIKALYEAGDPTQVYEEPERVIEVVENPDALETIGTPDLSMGFWSDFSSAIEIPNHGTKIVKLKNYSDGINNWDNYVLAFTNKAHDAHVDPNTLEDEDKKEWTVVRADAYAWSGEKNPETDPDNFVFSWDWGNWGTWIQSVMVDADVELEINREDNILNIKATNVDYNGTANVMTGAITTDMTADDACFMTILGEACYIELLSVSDKLSISANPDAVDAIGDVSLVVPFWSDWTEGYELKDNSSVKVKLHNYSDGANNWDNYVIAFCNGKTEAHAAPADQVEGYMEYGVCRADCFGWGDEAFEYSSENSWNDDWAAWLELMKNADVEITVSRAGGEITMDTQFTGADGTVMNDTAKFTSTMTADSPVYFFFTNEASYVEILSVE